MLKVRLILTLLLFLSQNSIAEENKNIDISKVWISAAPPTVSVLAAYAKIQNLSNEKQVLTSVTSPSFSKIELHLSKIINDVAKMEKQESLAIQANNKIDLTPGAYHLMLFNPKSPIEAGSAISLTFIFSDNTSKTVEAIVKKHNPGSHHHDHHH
ncbi:MAG: copper chaperone PCu(A)C [Pseudomonadota bacterium]